MSDDIKISKTFDLKGLACPMPVVKVSKGIKDVEVGDVIEAISTDPGSLTDIPAWANKVGHEYLGVLPADGYDKHFVCRKK